MFSCFCMDSWTCKTPSFPILYIDAMVVPNQCDYEAETVVATARRNVDAHMKAAIRTPYRDNKTVAGSDGTNLTRAQRVFATITKIRSAAPQNQIPGQQDSVSATTEHVPTPTTSWRIAEDFPNILFRTLEGQNGSISWSASGETWKIDSLEVFMLEGLPRFTGGSSMQHFAEFVHLLNTWGFQQILTGCSASAFYNEKFRRGDMQLVNKRVPEHDGLAPSNASRLIISRVLASTIERQTTGGTEVSEVDGGTNFSMDTSSDNTPVARRTEPVKTLAKNRGQNKKSTTEEDTKYSDLSPGL